MIMQMGMDNLVRMGASVVGMRKEVVVLMNVAVDNRVGHRKHGSGNHQRKGHQVKPRQQTILAVFIDVKISYLFLEWTRPIS